MTGAGAVLAALLAALAGACGHQVPAPPERPNVVLIVSDDQGWADVGWRSEEVRTPHLDRLAREGMLLERFYSQPVCTPSRAALMTGCSPMRYGMAYGPLKPWEENALPADLPTLAELLRAAGYQTALAGKWHLGHAARSAHPNERGFESFYGCLQGAIDHLSHERAGAPDLQRDGTTVDDSGYDTDLFTAEAVRVIEQRDRKRPLFLCIAYTSPHTPLQAPGELVARYPQLPERRRLVCAMIEHMDAGIGRVLEALDAAGMRESTLVLFCSDNGGARRDGGRNLPLNGGKATAFEGGIRVPALARWPGRIPAQSRSEQFSSVLDVLPTVAELTGLEPPAGLDGRSLAAQWLGAPPVARADLLFSDQDDGGDFWHAVIRAPWKLLEHETASGARQRFLFDVVADPEEKSDLAAANPALVDELAAALDAWRALSPGEERHSREPPRGWQAPADWALLAR